MMERSCPVCGSMERHKMDEIHLINFDGEEGIFDTQKIMCCEQCGFVYHEGIDMRKLAAHYNAYTSGSQIQLMTEDEKILNNNMADFVEYHLKTPRDAKILDIGCGYGWVIGLLKQRGYTQVVGMDTDEPLMKKLQANGFSVEIGSIYSGDSNRLNERFDMILLKMVMEHLEHPQIAIDNIYQWLKPNGVLVIEVPDCLLYDRAAFFTGYFQSVNMEHINNFSAVSLMNLMKNWRMVACESTESNGIFPVLRMAFRYDANYERALVYDSTDEIMIKKSLKHPSDKGRRLNYNISLLEGKSCVIWGVGSFTRGLLTYTGLKDMEIAFFVDRNTEYHKKTLMGKKILAPEAIGDFKGVIVIPGKNSQQAIIQNIQDLHYTNEIVCLSE